jgi:hypothetical protein
MIIECTIPREGNTEVSHAGFTFIFKPQPELTGGDTKAKVCDICADHAIARFLILEGMYREYQPKKHFGAANPAPIIEEKEEKKPVIHKEKTPQLKKKDSLEELERFEDTEAN